MIMVSSDTPTVCVFLFVFLYTHYELNACNTYLKKLGQSMSITVLFSQFNTKVVSVLLVMTSVAQQFEVSLVVF